MANNDRYVVKQGKNWAVKSAGQDKPESIHRTQGNAEARAKKTVHQTGGGELRIQGRDGKWRDSDTVAPAKDPYPPKDKKH